MPTYSRTIVVAGFVLGLPSFAFGQASFQGLGLERTHATAVSSAGEVIVGYVKFDTTSEAFLWKDGLGTILLGDDLPGGSVYSTAWSASADGSVVVGNVRFVVVDGSRGEAFLWRGGQMFRLGSLEADSDALATDVSADGSVVVGYGGTLSGTQPFRWIGGVMDGLGGRRIANAVSADGSVIVGYYYDGPPYTPFRWENGRETALSAIPSACLSIVATDVSADGSVVVGIDGCGHLLRWVNGVGTVLHSLGEFDDVIAGGNPFGVKCSSTGNVVVGGGFVWYPTSGLRSLREMLTNNFGLDLHAWLLVQATGISGDGSAIVGDGVNPGGKSEAWIVHLPADPVAICRDVTKDALADCKARLMPDEVDDGSFDPNGGSLNLTLTPSGPFPLGSHKVNLTAEDGQGLTSTCIATLTVTGEDLDKDGACGTYDNCPGVWNADQADSDADGVGDECDQCPGFDDSIDTDGDTVIDGCDACPNTPHGVLTNDDGCPLPFGPCCFGGGICIDATDGDDCQRVRGSYLGDGLTCAGDPDGDGISGCGDGCPLDPNKVAPGECGCGVADKDSDRDGTPDCVDGCPNDPAKTEQGACGCGVADIDTDGDGVLDCVDPCPLDNPDDSDGDGVCDSADPCPLDNQDDTDGDGVCDSDDGCPDDSYKSDPGICGCGVPDDDADADGVADCIDLCRDTPANVPVNGCGCVALGACCFPVGVCFNRLSVDTCEAIEGVYQGDGSACFELCGFGDFDGDGAVDLRDFAVFQNCYGADDTDLSEGLCRRGDIDRCQNIDLWDYVAFRRAVTGP